MSSTSPVVDHVENKSIAVVDSELSDVVNTDKCLIAEKPNKKNVKKLKIPSQKVVEKSEEPLDEEVEITTTNAMYKRYIANMPDILNTLKDINDYTREFKKINKDYLLNNKKNALLNTKKLKVKKVKKGFDKDGNVKEKRAPTLYNIFVKDQFPIIKNTNPELDKKEIFTEIAKVWKNRKHEVKKE
jgi:hypothetical protein